MSDAPIKKQVPYLNVIVSVASGLFVMGSLFSFYMNNIWHPKVAIKSVDWNSGNALITVQGSDKTLFGDAVMAGGWGWGIRFAKAPDSSGQPGYDRIELVRGDQVYHILDKKIIAGVD